MGFGPLHQPLARMGGKVGRAAEVFGLARQRHAHRLCDELAVLGLGQMVLLEHLRQHHIAALERALGEQHRVVVVRPLEHAHQRGALQRRQLGGWLVPVGAGRHLHAHCVVEEGRGVEVDREDLVLAVVPLDAQRRDQLLQLAVQRAAAADLFREQVACQLLRDGGAALQVAGGGVEEGTRRAPEIHAVVVAEAAVFGGDQGADHVRRDLGQGHVLLLGAAEGGEHLAVGRHQHRGAHGFDFIQVGRVGRGLQQHDEVDDGRRQQQGRSHQREAQGQAPTLGPGGETGVLGRVAGFGVHHAMLRVGTPNGCRTAALRAVSRARFSPAAAAR